MNARRVDTFARALSRTASRRKIVALLSGLVGLNSLPWPMAVEPSTAQRRRGSHGVVAAGPCGNGSVRKNHCRRDAQCCSGYCKAGKGRKRGRCRCRALNQACTQDRQCCSGRTGNHCQEGRCLPDPLVGCGTSCGTGERCWQGQCACGDVCASGCQFASVQTAVNSIAPGSTIRICSGVFGSVTLGENMTLLGAGPGANGTTLDGQGSGPVVVVGPGATAVLQGLQITGGAGTELGGGIDCSGNLTLNDCLVTGNAARACGGGIFNVGSLTLTSTDVTSNTSEDDGGGICSINEGTVTLNQSSVTLNSAKDEGGGIFNGGIGVSLDAQSSVAQNTPDNCAGNPVSGCTA